jgi:hypothetical protein
MPQPPFASGRGWTRGMGRSRHIKRRVWHDPGNGFEYEPDQRSLRGTWHEIDPRQEIYRDVDPTTGEPVAGSEGQWSPLK